MTAEQAQPVERQSFQAEVGRLLHIVANSLYSDTDVFLRELISNASDACDKMRYESLTNASLAQDDANYRIVLEAGPSAGTLCIRDNGIGMSRDELVDNLGTIARSGTAAFVSDMNAHQDETDDSKDPAASLIGQFGVGFYSAFMVASKVAVESRRANAEESWRWESDGLGEFTLAPGGLEERGTSITLTLKKDAKKKYTDPDTLRRIVREHSNHIGIPVALETKPGEEEVLNEASALWLQPKKDITPEQYADFYHHVSSHFDEPAVTLHARVEGKIEYALLLFVPTVRPFDLFDPARRHHVRLYVRRVFVAQEVEGLVPPYLRFLCGVVDSEDLDLNISREMLQSTPLIAKIQKDITRRVFRELKRLKEKKRETFESFWTAFGAVVKEGLYEDEAARGDILDIALFRTTDASGTTTLSDYVSRMKEGQNAIYYIVGDEGTIDRSPQLEGFRSRGIEVLLLSDPVDDFWVNTVGDYEGKGFKSITRGFADLKDEDQGSADDGEPEADDTIGRLVGYLKIALKDRIKDVRPTNRLTDSPMCVVAAEDGLDMHTERLLRQHGRIEQAAPRILEINPKHGAIKALAVLAGRENVSAQLEDAAHLLLDQAIIMEGELPPDASAYSRRVVSLLERSVNS